MCFILGALVSFIEWPKPGEDRTIYLNSLQSIPNEEVIKFIPRVLDSIFRILDESRTSRESCCSPSILRALVILPLPIMENYSIPFKIYDWILKED